ncbi:2-oxo acid dehydrogenase subunit E2 [Arthrobacter sp. JZ12]|uniref:dihydrolipoamide acetyltransferase family protein n=1 Tax=Arthrobacter sp. JZ12 TaxID=2654190 RepID=UPI002B4A6D36|nr:dihydrolipoamide acetyltransferase family protein [Arthrobacter sp. JZ12]WRH25717.1 2-oxo acid dehydrogenase subunit E2 [Arthrobacter sp. JZ12]
MSAETLTTAAGQVFLLPDLGEGLTEAELVNWLVAEGDVVTVDQPVAEVETAKSMVEVPSPYAGVVTRLHGTAGSTISVGAPLITVSPAEVGTPVAAAPVTAAAGEKSVAPSGPAPADAAVSGSGNVLIGYGTPAAGSGGRTRRRRALAATGTATATDAQPPAASQQGAAVSDAGPRAVLCISPLVRKLARDAGLSLRSISGTGAAGMILRRDVEQAIAASGARPASGIEAPASVAAAEPEATASEATPATSDGGSSTGEDQRSGLRISERIPVRGVRKAVAEAMTRSRREIPEATVWVDVDATALVELRADLMRRNPDESVGLLAFVARFALAGLVRYPELNSRIVEGEDGGLEILKFDGVNLGIAAQTDRGLMVPAIRRADRMSARQLDAEIRRLAAVTRDGKATPADLTSGTFTLNNYGVFGVDGSAAIINHPEAAILGLGRIIDRPWAVNGELAVRKVTELTLSFDHRVCDGVVAAGFLRYVADAVENPGGVLADL